MIEYKDLYDINRKLTGETIIRGEEIPSGRYFLAMEFVTVNPETHKILVTRRALQKNNGGMWEFTGGGVQAGETTGETAVREAGEEIGVHASEKDFELLYTMQRKNYFLDFYLLMQTKKIEEYKLQEEEVMDAKYVTPEELEKMIEEGVFVKSVGERYQANRDKILSKL